MSFYLSGIVSQELYYLFFGGSNWASSSRKIGSAKNYLTEEIQQRGCDYFIRVGNALVLLRF